MADGRGSGVGDGGVRSRGGGGGGGGGGGRGGSRRDDRAAMSPSNSALIHSEVYPGADEDLQYLASLLFEPTQPQDLYQVLGQDDGPRPLTQLEPIALSVPLESIVESLIEDAELTDFLAEVDPEEFLLPDMTVSADDVNHEDHRSEVTQQENQITVVPTPLAPNIPVEVEACLREGDWEGALVRLEQMVLNGQAVNGAVEGNASPHDIFKAHPELVLRLRGQILMDKLQQGNTGVAQTYYDGEISALYPNNSTGSPFVDKTIMRSIMELERAGFPASGPHAIFNEEETRKCVEDYLKIYFPLYRPRIREGRSRVWEYGEKADNVIRCNVCHKMFRGINLWKLRAHLIGQGKGKQGKCRAVTSYISCRLQQILAGEGFNPDGTLIRDDAAAAGPSSTTPLPPPPPPPPPPDDGSPPLPLPDGGDATG